MVDDSLKLTEPKPMRSTFSLGSLLTLLILITLDSCPILAEDGAAPVKVDFNRDIKPIISNSCYRCHGPDAAERKGGADGLRLDTAEGIFADLGGHAAVVAGKAESSELIQRVTSTDPDQVMPPPGNGKPLNAHEVALLKAWIQQGAKYSRHWSYVSPVRPESPAVKNRDWAKNGIDRFILARLEQEGLQPAREADRYELIRRVSLDLIGLPPTVEEVDAFVNDVSPNAYEKLVDQLLSKPAFGEHWGLLWLDLARYADSAGYADDPARKIWLFRDYVIRSFNENKPFDQFTVEQIAGDLLPPTDEHLVATAFHRNTLTNNEGGTNDEEFRNVAVVDRVTTTMAVWMGTTVTCAQCHNPKYDPITQEEFFKLFAFFNNTEDADRGDESPLHPIFTEDQRRQRTTWTSEIAQREETLKTLTPELKIAQSRWDTEFPRNLSWSPLKPIQGKSQAESAITLTEAGEILVAAGAKNDTYTIDLATPPGVLRALRLEALPNELLPGKGPGHAGGNFVITKISASIIPSAESSTAGRYIRIELPGEKLLSLAEVQVFSGNQNLALEGEATQISTDYGGDAKLAIDGNTNGHFYEAKSTTHTATGKDPWWEVDLRAEQKIDRIAVWNRTDGAGERLANYRIVLLNDRRERVWQHDVVAAPNPSAEFPVNGPRPVELAIALADYAQSGFDPAQVLNNPDPKTKGWAIGGELGQAHSLTLITKQAITIPAGSTLRVTIEQSSEFAQHTLGHFRFWGTNEARTEEWARTPAKVISALHKDVAERTPAEQELVAQHFLSIALELAETRQQLAAARKSLADLRPETVPVMKELTANRRTTKLQHRGNFMDLGQEVTEGTPAAFPPLPADAPKNRLTLARWLVDAGNPLTGRVMANRYWEQLFGIGIVATSEEFGSQGEQPVHPELLDWLACELAGIPEGKEAIPATQKPWDTKAFLKTLVMSATYRQSSKVSAELQQQDPDNRLLARGPRFRLSAETLRDQALLISGLLSPKMFGPPVKPPQPNLGLSAAFGSSTDWQTSPGEDKYRRGLYTTWRRSNPYPSMATFDAPNREVCTVRRVRTNTPLQALVTLNDPVYIEAAQGLARRIVKESGPSIEDRVRHGFRLTLARPPHENELKRLADLYARSLVRFEQSADEAMRMATDPLGPAETGANVSELAAWTVIGNVLLNLDETLMKR